MDIFTSPPMLAIALTAGTIGMMALLAAVLGATEVGKGYFGDQAQQKALDTQKQLAKKDRDFKSAVLKKQTESQRAAARGTQRRETRIAKERELQSSIAQGNQSFMGPTMAILQSIFQRAGAAPVGVPLGPSTPASPTPAPPSPTPTPGPTPTPTPIVGPDAPQPGDPIDPSAFAANDDGTLEEPLDPNDLLAELGLGGGGLA
jgi:hypothetical protein